MILTVQKRSSYITLKVSIRLTHVLKRFAHVHLPRRGYHRRRNVLGWRGISDYVRHATNLLPVFVSIPRQHTFSPRRGGIGLQTENLKPGRNNGGHERFDYCNRFDAHTVFLTDRQVPPILRRCMICLATIEKSLSLVKIVLQIFPLCFANFRQR